MLSNNYTPTALTHPLLILNIQSRAPQNALQKMIGPKLDSRLNFTLAKHMQTQTLTRPDDHCLILPALNVPRLRAVRNKLPNDRKKSQFSQKLTRYGQALTRV
jgi:hypothetical protein